jgi:hypothetical protein
MERSKLIVDKISWTIDLINKLQTLEIGNSERLKLIKRNLKNGVPVSDFEINYLKEKYKLIRKMDGITVSKTSLGKSIFEKLDIIKTGKLTKLNVLYGAIIIILLFPILMIPYDTYLEPYLGKGFSFTNFTNEELVAGKWIQKNTPSNYPLYSDPFTVLEFRGLSDRPNLSGIGWNQTVRDSVKSVMLSGDAGYAYNNIVNSVGNNTIIIITPRTSMWVHNTAVLDFPQENFNGFTGFEKFFDNRYFTLEYQSKNIFVFEPKVPVQKN